MERSGLNFQGAVDSSGEDSSRSIISPSTAVLSSSDPEKGEAHNGSAKRDATTSSGESAYLAPATACAEPHTSAHGV